METSKLIDQRLKKLEENYYHISTDKFINVKNVELVEVKNLLFGGYVARFHLSSGAFADSKKFKEKAEAMEFAKLFMD